jgi:riboflavin synthase
MFTGIVQARATVTALTPQGGDLRIELGTPPGFLTGVALGDSIACDGCCLTVVVMGADHFAADVSRETLALTTLGTWQVGQRVNLEQALNLGTPLGGHLVSGHVDGVGEVLTRDADARSWRFRLRAPGTLARYIATKGSVCVDGVSLTVNAVEGAEFEVNIVPHTLDNTGFGAYAPGSRVNLEVDLVARYLERLLDARGAT